MATSPPAFHPLRMLLDTTLDAVVVMNSDGIVTAWNDRAADMFGWTGEQAIGQNMAELIIPPQHRPAHYRGLKQFLETGEGPVLGRRIELSALRRNGEEFPVELAISPVREDGGVSFVGCLREISERVATQEAMRDSAESSERQLQLLVDGVKDCAIYMIDPQGRVTSWNSGASRIKGYIAEEIIGQHFSIFYTESDREKNIPMQALQRAVDEGKYGAEGWRRRKDGSRFWASILINPIHDRSGKLIGFAKVTNDVTDKHEAQRLFDQTRDRMLQVQKMEAIGQLTGGVAHDFNNLLMVITGNLESAQRNADSAKPSMARQRRSIGFALRGAQRAATLTQRLLAFSRRQPLNPKPLDMNRFIAGEVEFLQRSLGETIEVEAVGGAGLWQVEADLDQLEATLLNLAINARDAMPEGGKLTVETSNAFLDEEYCRTNPEVLPGQYVLIAVSDTGSGMTKEIMDRAFEPFFTTRAVGQGTGLGLSQVYGFIKQSGGHVKIYSEIDRGTTVKIYLPRLQRERLLDQAVELQEPAQGERGETILVVEDDEDVRAYLVEMLRDLDYRVLPAHDAVSGLGYIKEVGTRIDLLLTDVVLPGMSGRDLAHQAQQIRPTLKILFMTGYSRNAIVHQGRLDPGVELIQKPVTQDQLAARIRTLLDRTLPSETKN